MTGMSEQGRKPPLVVGVDVGGTKIAAAVVDAAGQIYGRVQVPTDVRGAEATLRSIAEAILRALSAAEVARDDVLAAGLGVPGKVDSEAGVGVLSVNLGWREVPVKALLEARLGLPCVLENDVKAATLGEGRFGAGRGMRNFIYLSVGTGIAAGLVLNGRLYRGSTGMAGEVGHAIVAPRGPRCKCGARGCLEAVASGPAIAARAMEVLHTSRPTLLRDLAGGPDGQVTAEQVFAAAAQGDPVAKEVVERAGAYLGLAISQLIMAFDPQVIILGGGVAQGGDLLLQAIHGGLRRQAAESFVFREMLRPEGVRLTALGTDVGILGAAALAMPVEGGP